MMKGREKQYIKQRYAIHPIDMEMKHTKLAEKCSTSNRDAIYQVDRVIITKTCLYNLDPLKPHFYIVKLRFTGVYIIFLISAQNKDCGYSLEPPRRGGSNEYPQSMF